MTPRTACLTLALLASLLLAGKVLVPKGAVVRLPFEVVPAGSVFSPRISANGRWVVLQTTADNILPDGNDGDADVFLVDTRKGTVRQVSLTPDGGDPELGCVSPAISPTGRFVAYHSSSEDIVAGDTPNTTDVFLYDTKTDTTARVSTTTSGGGSPMPSTEPAISRNGRWVAFSSLASNMVAGDTNNERDVFLRDMKSEVTVCVSLTSAGTFADGESRSARISANGRFVAFRSEAGLVPEDTNGFDDVYLYDAKQGTLVLASVGEFGEIGDSDSGGHLDLSANGRWVSFSSGAQNFVGFSVPFGNVFRRDVKLGRTELASAADDGSPGQSLSTGNGISPDGRYVAFVSFGGGFGPVDTNAKDDLYLKDMQKGTVERLSVGFDGGETDDTSSFPSLSKRARFVAFQSLATNLFDGPDGNASTDTFVKRR